MTAARAAAGVGALAGAFAGAWTCAAGGLSSDGASAGAVTVAEAAALYRSGSFMGVLSPSFRLVEVPSLSVFSESRLIIQIFTFT